MRTDTFGDSKASIILAEELTKDYHRKEGKIKIGEKQSAFVTRQLTTLGKMLNELTLLHDIRIKRSLAYKLRETILNNVANTKCIINDSVRSFMRNVIVTKINVWVEKENAKAKIKENSIKKKKRIDCSFLWHLADKEIDYNSIGDITVRDGKSLGDALNKAYAVGFRNNLRLMERLNLIEMGDIDRSPNEQDEIKYKKLLPEIK